MRLMIAIVLTESEVCRWIPFNELVRMVTFMRRISWKARDIGWTERMRLLSLGWRNISDRLGPNTSFGNRKQSIVLTSIGFRLLGMNSSEASESMQKYRIIPLISPVATTLFLRYI